ncbi:MAG TPA: metal ABC transporter ATP-binding protein [Solirubrobacteraceae bacterium]|jgi:ABC-type Mn2+/Zn2+ transport system ATPase subunit|nr:metal ABC transporter ATP-binding protein [Solirubrobacteraceae bacterium]
MTDEPVLAVDGLAVGYGGPPVLAGVTFAAARGQRVAVLGPNGGGKSTLFRAVLGELPPVHGRVTVRGRAGTVPQTERSRLDYPVTALDVALMGTLSRLPWWRRPGRAEHRGAREALGVVGLAQLAGAAFGELSGGQRQRVLVARALVQDADLLLLDEPFSGVDEPTARRLEELFDRMAAEGRTLLMATHDLEQARAWDRVLCLNRRQVAFGRPGEVLTRAALEATYGGAVVTLPAAGDEAEHAVLPPHHHRHA